MGMREGVCGEKEDGGGNGGVKGTLVACSLGVVAKRKLAEKRTKKTYKHRVSRCEEDSDVVHAATRGTATSCAQRERSIV
jgi:hypothetical protein